MLYFSENTFDKYYDFTESSSKGYDPDEDYPYDDVPDGEDLDRLRGD